MIRARSSWPRLLLMGDIMDIKDIEKLYLHRQSCRSFDLERPVSDELLREVCRLALLAPSACNSQPWKLLAVTGEKAKQLAAGVQDLGMNKFASDAPAFIVVLEGTGNLTATVGSRFKNTDFLHNDIGIMTAHLVLAAEAAGLATCILGWRNEEKLRNILLLPEKTRIPHIIAIGYASAGYETREKKRKSMEDTFVLLK